MDNQSREIKIFLSYCWDDKVLAESLVTDIEQLILPEDINIKIIKDDRQIGYKFSLIDFMSTIRNCNYAFLLISDSYLKSKNCMHEVLELKKESDYKDKMLPILVEGTNVFKPEDNVSYAKFWKLRFEKITEMIEEASSPSNDLIPTRGEKKIINQIYNGIDEFINDLQHIRLNTLQQLKDDNYELLLKYCNISPTKVLQDFNINENQHIIDQLNEAIDLYFKSFSFLPLQRLKTLTPFTINGFSYIGDFYLSTDNENIINLLNDLELLNKGETNHNIDEIIKVENYKGKIYNVIEKLLANNIRYISSNKSRRNFDLLSFIDSDCSAHCECVHCLYTNFDYYKLFLKLKAINENTPLNDKMDIAYYEYELGNYESSRTLYKECALQAKAEKKLIIKYICDYNILNLNKLLRNGNERSLENSNWYIESFITKKAIIPKLDAIKSEGLHEEFFYWINNGRFLSDDFYNIDTTLQKIQNHFQIVSNNGYSYNQNVFKLLFIYRNVHKFIRYNGFTYDHFTEYISLSRKFIEGIIITNTLPQDQTGFNSLDVVTMQDIILYADSKEFLGMLTKYKVTFLKCEDDVLNSIIVWFHNVINSCVLVTKEYLDEKNIYFWNKRNNILANFLILFRYLDFSVEKINFIAEEILNLLKKGNFIVSPNEHYLFDFFFDKIQYIKAKTSIELLKLSYESGIYHSKVGFSYLYSIIKRYNLPISKIVKRIRLIQDIDQDCITCGWPHHLSYIIPLLSLYKERSNTSKKINSFLRKNFDSNVYSLALHYDLIDSSEFEKSFVEECIASTIRSPKSTKSIFSNNDEFKYNSDFLMLLLLLANKKINIEQNIIDRIKELGGFYAWAISPSEYDYSKFDANWLKLLPVEIFESEYFNMSLIKPKLREYLIDNDDRVLKHLYFNY